MSDKKHFFSNSELGCHIDGYICVEACSLVIGEADKLLTGRKADLLAAVNTAAEAALRTIKTGNKNSDVTEVVTKAARQFNCNPVIGIPLNIRAGIRLFDTYTLHATIAGKQPQFAAKFSAFSVRSI